MRICALALAVPFALLVGCAQKSSAPETVTAPPPVVTVQPSAPAQPPSVPAPRPPAPPTPAVATPSPAGSAPSPTPAPEPPSTERLAATSVLYVSVQRANFRQAPDVKARILAVLTKGTKLTVLDKSAQWYRVRLDDGKEGWVAESVTSPKPD
ncbi:MAG: SH3 domain-containing protein [Candidatus Rokuibacteriota bacterium]